MKQRISYEKVVKQFFPDLFFCFHTHENIESLSEFPHKLTKFQDVSKGTKVLQDFFFFFDDYQNLLILCWQK